jgi:hypothetical protein
LSIAARARTARRKTAAMSRQLGTPSANTGQLGFSGMVLPGWMTSRSTCQCSQRQRKLVRHLGQAEPPVSRPDGGWPHHRRQALRQPPARPLRARRPSSDCAHGDTLHRGPELFYSRVEPIPELRHAGTVASRAQLVGEAHAMGVGHRVPSRPARVRKAQGCGLLLASVSDTTNPRGEARAGRRELAGLQRSVPAMSARRTWSTTLRASTIGTRSAPGVDD